MKCARSDRYTTTMSMTPTVANLLGPISIGIILSSVYVDVLHEGSLPLIAPTLQCIRHQSPADVYVLH